MEDEASKMEGIDSGKKAVLFILPSIFTVLLTSTYGVADALVVVTKLGPDALASIVSILPIQYLLTALSMMFASGSASHIGHLIGRKEYQRASSHMSTIILFVTAVSVTIMLMFATIIGTITHFIGVNGVILSGAMEYGQAFSFAIPFFMMQYLVSQILIVTGRGKSATALLSLGLILNIVYDFYMISFTDLGLSGTGYSTIVGTMFSTLGCVYLLYFDKKSILKRELPSKNLRILIPICKNGLPQTINTLTLAISTTLLLMFSVKLTGTESIAARSIAINLQALLNSLYIGYNQGSISLTSYFYGKEDRNRIIMMFRTGMIFAIVLGLIGMVTLQIFDTVIADLFMESEYTKERVNAYLTTMSYTFIMTGLNMFVASMFVAASDSKHANLISFTRTVYLGIPVLCIMSLAFGTYGLAHSSIITEGLTLCLTVFLVYRYGYRCGFLKKEPFTPHLME